MSVEATTYVWTTSNQKHTALLLLLAIADYVNDDGEAWPGVAALARKARMTVRNVQLLLKKLIEAGEIAIDHNRGVETKTGYTNRYILVGFVEWFKEVQEISPRKSQGVKISASRGENSGKEGVQEISPDPSLRSIIDPSINTLAASHSLAAGAPSKSDVLPETVADEKLSLDASQESGQPTAQGQQTNPPSVPLVSPLPANWPRGTGFPDEPLPAGLSYGYSKVGVTCVRHFANELGLTLCGNTNYEAKPSAGPCGDCADCYQSYRRNYAEPRGQQGKPLPEITATETIIAAPNGYTWHLCAGDNVRAHLVADGHAKPLCKHTPCGGIREYTIRTDSHYQPCPDCQRIAAEKAQSKPAKVVDNRHGELFNGWIEGVGKDNLPAGFSYAPFMNFCKALVKEGKTAVDLECAGLLFRAWHEGNDKPVLDWKPGPIIDAIRKAIDLCKRGIDAQQVTDTVKLKRQDPFWASKIVPFSYVATNIIPRKATDSNGSSGTTADDDENLSQNQRFARASANASRLQGMR